MLLLDAAWREGAVARPNLADYWPMVARAAGFVIGHGPRTGQDRWEENAGYTPFTLVTLRGPWGWSLFGVSWGLAALGIVQELTLGRRTRSVSMVLYVLMGWLALVAVRPLVTALPAAGTAWLLAGGIIYSAGIYFFINDERIRHGHGIWHLFVLAGSLCQFVSVARYVA